MCKCEYKRICPKCGNIIYYKSKISLNHALKNNSNCNDCRLKMNYEKCNKNNVKILLNENLESYYWIGFILADGHIENNKRIQITLSNKDKIHLEKFKKYVNAKSINNLNVNGHEQCSLSVQDIKYVPILCEKFKIKNNKTTNPPDVNILRLLESEKLYSLIIGYIDGDGNIKKQFKRNDVQLSVKCHKSWYNILSLFSEVIDGISKVKINSYGYAEFHVTKNSNLKKLKNFAIENNLPILERKWNNIDVNYISKYELAIERKNKVKELCNKGKTIKEISDELNLKYITVYTIINKNNFNIVKDERKSHKKNGGNLSEEKGN